MSFIFSQKKHMHLILQVQYKIQLNHKIYKIKFWTCIIFFDHINFANQIYFFLHRCREKITPGSAKGRKEFHEDERQTDRRQFTWHSPIMCWCLLVSQNISGLMLLTALYSPICPYCVCICVQNHLVCDNCCVTTVSKDRHRDTGQDNVSTASRPIIFIYLNMKFLYCDFVCSS